MSDENTTETTPENVTELKTTTDLADENENGGNREAAKYRRRLRETETERDQLAAQVENYRRAAVETLAAQTLSKPAALWAAGATVTELLDEAGQPDPEKVTEAARAAAETLGLQRADLRRSNHVPGEGRNPSVTTRTPRFEDALNLS